MTTVTSASAGAQAVAVRCWMESSVRGLGATLDPPGVSKNWQTSMEQHFPPLAGAADSLRAEIKKLREELRGARRRAA